jgi:hypothetical protein
MTKDFPRMPLPLTVIETNQQEKTNEFSETIHLGKKNTGRSARQAPRSELNLSCSESARSNLSPSDRKLCVILEELESINATRTQPPRGSRALCRHIE